MKGNTMTETPMALDVCCCGMCAEAGHEKETYRPLTADEITEREAQAAAYAEQQAAAEAEAAAKAESRAALLDRLGITADEAALLLG